MREVWKWVRRALFLTVLLFCTCIPSLAQQESSTYAKSSLDLATGYNSTFLKDRNFSPLNYRAGGSAILLQYVRSTRKGHKYTVKLDYSSSKLKTEASDHFTADRYLANIELGYLRKIAFEQAKFQIWAGGQFHTYMDLVFFDDVESITFFAIHGLDLAANLSYNLNSRNSLAAHLAIPVLGIFVRPPYSGWDKFIMENSDNPVKILTTGPLTSVNDYFGLNANLEYRYSPGDRVSLQIQNQVRYYWTSVPDKTRNFNFQLIVGIRIHF